MRKVFIINNIIFEVICKSPVSKYGSWLLRTIKNHIFTCMIYLIFWGPCSYPISQKPEIFWGADSSMTGIKIDTLDIVRSITLFITLVIKVHLKQVESNELSLSKWQKLFSHCWLTFWEQNLPIVKVSQVKIDKAEAMCYKFHSF